MAPPTGGKNPEAIVTKMGVEWDASEVATGLRKLGTDWSKRMRQIEKKSQESMKGSGKSIKQFMWQLGGAKKEYKRLYEEQVKALRGTRSEYAKSIKVMREAEQAVANINKELQSVDKTAEPDLFAGVSKRLDEAQKKLEKTKSTAEKMGKERSEAMEGVKDIKDKFTFNREEVVDGFKEAGAELWGPFESLLNKDLPGAIEKGGKLAGKGWETLFKKGGHIFKDIGKALSAKGSSMKQRGGVMGKVAGAGAGAAGGMFKAMGGLMKMLSTLGPILATVSSVIVGIVKLLLEAEAGAKELNKQILSTAGSAEFFSRNLKDSDAAASDLEGTLKNIRDAATSLDNMDWGINKETHTAVLNAITAEGVSLKKLDDDFKRVGKSAQGATGYAKDWGSMVQMSVAYSRSFGVSLQDVSQFQGELMSELGQNLDQVETSFQYMLKGAEESGIATNKFFGIIRGFSADMSLFNVRMEDVTKTMIMLGKAMSPREAQKMLSSLTTMFKGKSLIDRTRDVIMGGPKVRQAMVAQQSAGTKRLAEDTGIDEDDLKAALKSNNADLGKWIAKKGKRLNDDQKKAIYEASLMQHKLDSKDSIDLASSIKDANPWTAKKIAEAKVASITGGKKIEDLKGINRIAAEQAAEVSDELQDQVSKMTMAVESSKAELAKKLEQSNGDASKFSDDELKMLERLGVDLGDSKTYGKLSKAGAEDFYNSMDESQQKMLSDGKAQIDYQKKTAGFQTSVMDKLGVLVEFIMNQIYDVMSNLYDSVLDLLNNLPKWMGGGATGNRHQQDLAKTIQKGGNGDLIEAWGKSHGDEFKFKDEMIKSVGGRMDRFLDQSSKDAREIQDAIKDESNPKKKAALEKKLADVQGKRQNVANKLLGNLNPDQYLAALKDAAGGGDPKLQAALDAMTKGSKEDQTKAFADLSGSMDSVNTLLGKAQWQLTPDQIAKAMPDISKALEDTGLKDFTKAATTDSTIYTHDTHAEDTAATMMSTMEDQGGTLSDIYDALRLRGIKLDKPFLENQFKGVIRDAVYDAASEALTDYYVLQHMDAGEALKAIQQGGDPKSLAKGFADQLASGKRDVDNGQISPMKPNAAGGVISAVRNGMAVVRPAAGEGMLTGRPGERIGGGGGGPQVVHVMFKGDASKILETHMDNRIAYNKTKQMQR